MVIKQKTDSAPIGVFDSGVGGLSVLNAIQTLMPEENLIYLADTQYTPYGERSTQFIHQRVNAVAEFLVQQQVKTLVVACNTATAAAIQSLREQYNIPIIGLEPALKPAVEYLLDKKKEATKKVGILATQATLDSEKYQKLRARFHQQVDIIEKASPLFVEMVESGASIGDTEKHLIQKELGIFIEQKVDSLVLGCTHFPFLTQTIQHTIGEDVKLFESAIPVASEVKRQIKSNRNTQTTKGYIKYFSNQPEIAKQKFNQILQQPVDVSLFNI